MRDYERRLHALEVKWLAPNAPPWAIMDALHRAFAAAVRDKLRRRLDGIEDTPEQAAELTALRDQWRALCSHGAAEGARARLTERLDRMAERQRASTLDLPTPRSHYPPYPPHTPR
jgi:hypothetical protein